MRRLVASVLFLLAPLAHAQPDKPLPAVAELQARAIANFRKSEKDRERYLCTERIENDELDSHGTVTKRDIRERELFYVNGFAISQTVSKDNRPLGEADRRKRDEAVQAAIHSASAHKAPKEEGLVLSAGDLLRVAQLTHERRILVAGRPTIVFDVVSNPQARADTIGQKVMRAMEGTVSIDEATGNIQDVTTHGIRDVKVGGGLVANIHKGFRVHMLAEPQDSEGVWLLVLAEGTGGARIGLFLNKGDQFRQETRGCKLFDVNAEATTPKSSN